MTAFTGRLLDAPASSIMDSTVHEAARRWMIYVSDIYRGDAVVELTRRIH